MAQSEGQVRQDRATAAGLAGGAVVLAVGTGERWPVMVAAGMLVGALMAYRRTVQDQPYAYWVAWVAGAVLAWSTSCQVCSAIRRTSARTSPRSRTSRA
jgi:hypothetical protein